MWFDKKIPRILTGREREKKKNRKMLNDSFLRENSLPQQAIDFNPLRNNIRVFFKIWIEWSINLHFCNAYVADLEGGICRDLLVLQEKLTLPNQNTT